MSGIIIAAINVAFDSINASNIASWFHSGIPSLLLLWIFVEVLFPLLSGMSLVEEVEGMGIGLGLGYIAGGLIIGDSLTAGLACIGIGLKLAKELDLI